MVHGFQGAACTLTWPVLQISPLPPDSGEDQGYLTLNPWKASGSLITASLFKGRFWLKKLPWPASEPVLESQLPRPSLNPPHQRQQLRTFSVITQFLYFLMEYSVFMYMKISWGNRHGYCLRHLSFLCAEEIQKALSWLS